MGDTDWRAEITAFQKGVVEDATHVQHQAHAVAKEGVTRIENLPHQAKFPPMDSAKLKTQFDQVLIFPLYLQSFQESEESSPLFTATFA